MRKSKKIITISLLAFIVTAYLIVNLPRQPVIIHNKLILVELAQTQAERIKGLQGRTSLGRNRGMLFIFDQEDYLRFWMKDTLIPLSIAFIDKHKKIVDIQRMEPRRSDIIYISSKKSKYALEMNAGWFEKNGIKPRQRLIFW